MVLRHFQSVTAIFGDNLRQHATPYRRQYVLEFAKLGGAARQMVVEKSV